VFDKIFSHKAKAFASELLFLTEHVDEMKKKMTEITKSYELPTRGVLQFLVNPHPLGDIALYFPKICFNPSGEIQ